MNRQKLLCFVIMLLTAHFVYASDWYDSQMERIDKAEKLPPDERFEILGGIVSVDNNPNLDEEAAKVHKRSQSILLATPGHAEYFGGRILKAYQLLKSGVIERNDNSDWSSYTSSLYYYFPALAQLPSPETVRVIGDMLSEEWEVPGQDKKHEYTPSLAFSTLTRMNKLPLVKKPSYPQNGTDEDYQKALTAWQHWYAQIKEGRRTFQFVGDPKIYSLQGPVRDALDPDAPRALRRDANDDKSQKHTPNSKSLVAKTGAISLLLIALFGWFWMKRRKEKA